MEFSKLLRIGIAIILIDIILVALVVFIEIKILKQSETEENKIQETKLEQIYTPEGTKIRAKSISEYAKNELVAEDKEWI